MQCYGIEATHEVSYNHSSDLPRHEHQPHPGGVVFASAPTNPTVEMVAIAYLRQAARLLADI